MNNVIGSLRCQSCDKVLEDYEMDDNLCLDCLGVVEKDLEAFQAEEHKE